MSWRQDVELSGMNVLTLGIWYEAMARWVGHATSVFAQGRVCVTERLDEGGIPRKMEIPDHLDVLAQLDNQVQAHVRVSAVTGHGPAPWSVYLYGEDGTLEVDAGKNRLRRIRRGEASYSDVPIPPDEAQHWRVEEEFVGAIRGEEAVRLTSFEEGVRYMEFTGAVHRSLREGRRIDLAEKASS